jgi:hypothetical protein
MVKSHFHAYGTYASLRYSVFSKTVRNLIQTNMPTVHVQAYGTPFFSKTVGNLIQTNTVLLISANQVGSYASQPDSSKKQQQQNFIIHSPSSQHLPLPIPHTIALVSASAPCCGCFDFGSSYALSAYGSDQAFCTQRVLNLYGLNLPIRKLTEVANWKQVDSSRTSGRTK